MYFRSNRGTPEPDSLSYQGEDGLTDERKKTRSDEIKKYLILLPHPSGWRHYYRHLNTQTTLYDEQTAHFSSYSRFGVSFHTFLNCCPGRRNPKSLAIDWCNGLDWIVCALMHTNGCRMKAEAE